jgi:putative aldouronate transport system permease protein
MIKQTRDKILFDKGGYLFITVLAVFCLIPFLLIVSGSFTDERSIYVNGYNFIPKVFSLSAYKFLLSNTRQLGTSYLNSIFIMTVGTSVGLFLISMASYALQRKDFRYRNQLSFFIFFTTLFQGGLVPWYILMVRYLGLKDTYMALIIPLLMNVFNIIIMKSYMRSIPESIAESAKIDGAGEFTIFCRLILPLSKPGLATVGLFMALAYWNDWFSAMMFVNDQSKYPLQFLLYKILQSAEFSRNIASTTSITIDVPTETFKMSTAVVVTGPIILLYPFVQRFFVKGLIIGAVKG